MKYNLKKKIEQNMKTLELKSNKKFSAFMKYPDPSKHELVLEKENSIYKKLSNGEMQIAIKYHEGNFEETIKEELEPLCYSAFQLYLEQYSSFDSLIKKTKEPIEDSEYFMQLWIYDEDGDQLYSDYLIDWTYARACFPVLFDKKNLIDYSFAIDFHKDYKKEIIHAACYLEKDDLNGHKFTTFKLTYGNRERVHPVKRLRLPNGTEWHDANSSQFEV